MAINRTTRETEISLDVRPGGGEPRVRLAWKAGGGLDEAVEPTLAEHFFATFLRYAGFEGSLDARGDLAHHVIEDCAIVLGRRLGEAAVGAVVRFADRSVPMDDALALAAIDMGGRAHYHSNVGATSRLWDHVLRTLAFESGSTLHVSVIDGVDPHHIVEAAFKATALCVRDALRPSARVESAKGAEVIGPGPAPQAATRRTPAAAKTTRPPAGKTTGKRRR